MAEVVRVLPANSLLHRRKEYSEEDCGGRQQEWRLTRQLRRVPIKLLHRRRQSGTPGGGHDNLAIGSILFHPG
ncbi:MAG: hypothetical protein DMG41_26840 [Acidobacteria bacterium]|nr:MAG: hypothetical protein DMG41_26840 [Acidobacteriota bacterium]